MKKGTAVLAMILLLTAVPAFAGGEQEAAEETEVVEVEFMNWMEQAELEGWETIFTSFQDEFPSVEFNLNSVPGGGGYEDKLKIRVMTDDAPEVFQASVKQYFKTLCRNGFVMPLNEYAENDEDFSFDDYPAKLIEAFTIDGKVYGLPKDNSVMGLVYNKELFDHNGLDYPDDTWTWDDLKAAAEEIAADTNNDGRNDVFGFASFRMKQMWLETLFLIGYGGPGAVNYAQADELTIDHPKNIEALEFFREMFREDNSAPDPSSQLNAVELFNAGKLGMLVGATHMFPGLFDGPIDFAATVTPMNENGDRAVTLLTSGFAVSQNARHPDDAWEVIKYLGYGEGNRILSQSSGSVPGTTRWYDNFLTDEMLEIGMDEMLQMTEYQYPRNYGQKEEAFMKVYQEFLDQVFTTDRPVEQILDEYMSDFEANFEPF
jgi:multiple sugar transport system substrate-binding protein